MTESAILEVRHVRLADEATLSPAPLAEGEDGVFVALAEPPPVRTVLSVVQGDQRRALEVARVVEVATRDEHGTRGFYGRWVEGDALERAAKVGTEHLEDGTPVVQPVSRDDNAPIVASDAPVMAVPAPVMSVDDTGVISVDDREDADEVDENARTIILDSAPGEASDGAEDSGEATTEAAGEDSPVQSDAESTEASEDSPVQADTGNESTEASEDSPVQAEAEAAQDSPAQAEPEAEKKEGGRRRGGRKKRGRRKR